MYNRHNEVPVYTRFDGRVEAHYFNHAQLALKRLGSEIRLQIPGLKTLDLILQKDAWVIVDRAFNDIPVAAWTDFEVSGRGALHEPVPCRIRYYHANAAIIMRRVLDAMETLLGEQLKAGDASHRVIEFPDRE